TVCLFFLSHGVQISRFSHYSSLVARQISWGTSESAPPFNVNVGLCGSVTVGQRGKLPHRKGRDSGEQHFTEQAQTEKHTNQITPKQDYNACESSLFTHIFTLLCINIYIYIYILPRSTNVLSFLHTSVIWIWWGSAPPAPNVETPLCTHKRKIRASCISGHSASLAY